MKLALTLAVLAVLPAMAGEPDLEAAFQALEKDVRSLARAEGLERADELLALEDDGGARLVVDRQRADVHFARGLLLALAPDEEQDFDESGALQPDWPRSAEEDFASAQAHAGPGELRLDATYNLGWIDLAAAEGWYARIPEVMQAAGVPPPQPPAAGAEGDAEPPDPLDKARQRYVAARKGLLVRLRADWRDEDTRANLEWIQRRLSELDRIEKEREQQQDENQDQEDENQDQESSDDQEPSDDEEGEDSDESSDENEEPSDREQQEQEDEGEEEQEQEGEQEPPTPEEGDESEDEPEPSEPSEDEAPPERVLTKEEVMRLLDRLEELEQEGERVRALMRESRRVPVERDW